MILLPRLRVVVTPEIDVVAVDMNKALVGVFVVSVRGYSGCPYFSHGYGVLLPVRVALPE
jgi:hypothetical protein